MSDRPSAGVTIHRGTTTKSRGRPLAAVTHAIRAAILALPERGYEQMTVRGIFYVLATERVVAKTEAGYRQVQRQALLLRRDGQLPWHFVADATRRRRFIRTWGSVGEAIADVSRTYRRDRWRAQRRRVEVWLEKDALSGLVAPVTDRYGVDLLVSRGQSSDTFVYDAAEVAEHAWDEAGIETTVLALYDADCFGRDAAEKIRFKLSQHAPGVPIDFRLVAVTDDQVGGYGLPTRPDKRGEGRAVELDALQVVAPGELERILEDAIRSLIHAHVWNVEAEFEESERETLSLIARGWKR
jgi:hypothetical protein